MNGLAPKIAVGAGSLALAFLGAEAALRVCGFDPLEEALRGRVQLVRASAFPGRGYELVPLARGVGWGAAIEVNAHGFRGPDVDPSAVGRTRVVALGDSVTFGNDLDSVATWPAVLEGELRSGGAAVDVLNLGLGGYDTTQEVATLEAIGLAYRPAHVVLAYCVNDVGIVSMSMETPFVPEDRERPLYLSRIAQWLHARGAERAQLRSLAEQNREEAYGRAFASEIDALTDPALVARLDGLRAAVARAPAPEHDLATRRIPPRWYASPNRIGRLAHAFARLAALAREHDFAVTVLLVPYLEDDPLIEQGLALVRALAEAQEFTVVDPRAEFVLEGLRGLRIRPEDPVHPNAHGHELMARAVEAAVGDAIVTPPTESVSTGSGNESGALGALRCSIDRPWPVAATPARR